MYQVFVPVMCRPLSEKNREKLLGELRRLQPTAVFLVFDRIMCNDTMLDEFFAVYMGMRQWLEENGFAVYTWLAPTIGYGGTAAPFFGDNTAAAEFERIRFVSGEKVYAYCPLHEDFRAAFAHTLQKVVSTGTKLILFEDDYTMSGGKRASDVACCCDRHMALLAEELGYAVPREDLPDLLLSGKGGPVRDAWLRVQGDTLRDFTAFVERTVHAIDPTVRIGLSANSSSFTMEGVTADELARIVAGNTRPFMRLTGAPYWRNALTLGPNVEAIRLQTAWCGEDIEMMTEGDTFPRPRYMVSAAQLENYDMILRAAGGTQGILKYMLDYTASATYETGYIDRHLRHAPHYAEIERRFSDMQPVGVNLFEHTDLFRHMEFTDLSVHDIGDRGYLPTVSQWMACENSLPLAYGAAGYGHIVFGENGRYVTEEMLGDGLVLDAIAAKILHEAGVDIGLASYTREYARPRVEYFHADDEYTDSGTNKAGSFYRYELKPGAEVMSSFLDLAAGGLSLPTVAAFEDMPRYPSCYRYENGKGQRFLVYAFVPGASYVEDEWAVGLFRNYCRARQMIAGIEWVQRRPLPAVCPGNPMLYILCKKRGDRMSVALFNLFEDDIAHPVITLDAIYTHLDCYGAEGHLCEKEVHLDAPLPPYGFAFFTVSR